MSPSSDLKTLLSSCFLLDVLFDLEGGGNTFSCQAMQYYISEEHIESYSCNGFWDTSAAWLFMAKYP